MTIAIESILDQVVSHAMTTGLFERVNTHEPKNAPGSGLSAAIWVDSIGPVPQGSGLMSTTGRVALHIRLFANMLQEPQDAIDPNMIKAVDVLMGRYSGDFELGSSVRNVDLLGQAGAPLSAQAGYINQDGKLYRVMTILLPVIVNDLWDQVP